MNCKYCGHELPAGSNPRREFCHDAHKQAYYRQQHQQDQSAALLAELKQLRAQVYDLAQVIEEQTRVIAKLQDQLDFKKRYHSTTPYNFKTWLRKQTRKTPLMQKILDYPFEKEKTSRHNYEEKLRRQLYCTEEEMRDFNELWIQMLLSQT